LIATSTLAMVIASAALRFSGGRGVIVLAHG
jgi:hypothetical protein